MYTAPTIRWTTTITGDPIATVDNEMRELIEQSYQRVVYSRQDLEKEIEEYLQRDNEEYAKLFKYPSTPDECFEPTLTVAWVSDCRHQPNQSESDTII